MAFADDTAAANDPRVISQVTAAIYTEAEQIYSTSAVAAQKQFATKVVTGQQNLTPLILSAVSFGSLTSASTDTSVSNAVATLWPMWSGG